MVSELQEKLEGCADLPIFPACSRQHLSTIRGDLCPQVRLFSVSFHISLSKGKVISYVTICVFDLDVFYIQMWNEALNHIKEISSIKS